MDKRTLKSTFIGCALIVFILFLTPSANEASSPTTDPVTTDHFQVQWGGSSLEFHSIEGLESRVEVVEYRDGLSPEYAPYKIPGKVQNRNIILRRPYIKADNELWDWYKLSMNGKPEYRDITISILNRSHVPVVTFKISNAFPCAYRGPYLLSTDRQFAMEEVEIAYQAISVEND